MKYISFAIPSYNSEAYMEHAINTILSGGEDVEIIIVNDGSKDKTSEIAHSFAEKYPTIIKAIDKPNGGHGDAVMMGLMYATGEYFKVVDSDDWVCEESLKYIIEKIKDLHNKSDKMPDMILSNYVYEKEGKEKKKVIKYDNIFKKEEICDWSEASNFIIGQYILMHSVMYKTELLQNSGMTLPRHTFYVDNIFVYYPLPLVKSIYYIDVDFYRYYIGREDQSVNESVMMGRVDQQIKVNKLMIDMYDLSKIKDKKLRKYMRNYLGIMMTVTSILLIRIGDKEALEKKKDIWKYLKEKTPRTYLYIRHSLLGNTMNLPGKPGRKVSVLGYKMARKIFGFN